MSVFVSSSIESLFSNKLQRPSKSIKRHDASVCAIRSIPHVRARQNQGQGVCMRLALPRGQPKPMHWYI